MEMIFQDAKDKYVTAAIVYGKAADGKLYTDAAFTTEATEAEVKDAFDKNVLMVKVGDACFRPAKVDENKVLVVDLASGVVSATEFTAKAAS